MLSLVVYIPEREPDKTSFWWMILFDSLAFLEGGGNNVG